MAKVIVKFTVGDNDNEAYRRQGTAEVSSMHAYAMTHTWEDQENDDVYNNFCDKVVPNVIDNLPYDWYFIDSPKP